VVTIKRRSLWSLNQSLMNHRRNQVHLYHMLSCLLRCRDANYKALAFRRLPRDSLYIIHTCKSNYLWSGGKGYPCWPQCYSVSCLFFLGSLQYRCPIDHTHICLVWGMYIHHTVLRWPTLLILCSSENPLEKGTAALMNFLISQIT